METRFTTCLSELDLAEALLIEILGLRGLSRKQLEGEIIDRLESGVLPETPLITQWLGLKQEYYAMMRGEDGE